MSDTIKTLGFLSREIETYQAQYLAQFATAFERAATASKLATTRLFALDVAQLQGAQSHALLFWMKCVGHCQAAYLLLEKGMAVQAQTLIRSAAEDLFYACALLHDETVVTKLAEQELVERRKQATGMLRDSPNLLPKQRQQLEELLTSLPTKAQGVSAHRAAEIAGLLELYQTVYRGMSLLAAHGTLTSVSALVETGQEDRLQMVFGPSRRGIEWTLSLVTALLECGNERFAAIGR
jgi:hypothetical protein